MSIAGLYDLLRAIHAMCIKATAALATIFPFLAPFAAIIALLGSMEAGYTTMITEINGLAAHVRAMPAATWLGQANRLFPITEILLMLGALLGLRVSASVIRFFKSWIPGS